MNILTQQALEAAEAGIVDLIGIYNRHPVAAIEQAIWTLRTDALTKVRAALRYKRLEVLTAKDIDHDSWLIMCGTRQLGQVWANKDNDNPMFTTYRTRSRHFNTLREAMDWLFDQSFGGV